MPSSFTCASSSARLSSCTSRPISSALSGRVDPLVEILLGAGRVDAEERGVDVVRGGEAHRGGDPVEHLLARDADRLELEVGDRRLDHRGADAEFHEQLEVGGHGAREAPDLGLQACAGDELDRVPIVLGYAREARLDPLDPEPVEQPCNLELVLRREHDAHRLLSVAQRGVVEAHAAADREPVVQRPRPDQVVLSLRHRSGPLRRGRRTASRRRSP
jgi:hypothetical protein